MTNFGASYFVNQSSRRSDNICMSTDPNYTAISIEFLEQGISFSGLCEGGCMRFDGAPWPTGAMKTGFFLSPVIREVIFNHTLDAILHCP